MIVEIIKHIVSEIYQRTVFWSLKSVTKFLLQKFLLILNINYDGQLTNYSIGQFLRVILFVVTLFICVIYSCTSNYDSWFFCVLMALSFLWLLGIIRGYLKLRRRNSPEKSPQIENPKKVAFSIYSILYPQNWKLEKTEFVDDEFIEEHGMFHATIESKLYFLTIITHYDDIEKVVGTAPGSLHEFMKQFKANVDSTMKIIKDSVETDSMTQIHEKIIGIREKMDALDDYGKQSLVRQYYTVSSDKLVTHVLFQYVESDESILMPGIQLILNSFRDSLIEAQKMKENKA